MHYHKLDNPEWLAYWTWSMFVCCSMSITLILIGLVVDQAKLRTGQEIGDGNSWYYAAAVMALAPFAPAVLLGWAVWAGGVKLAVAHYRRTGKAVR